MSEIDKQQDPILNVERDTVLRVYETMLKIREFDTREKDLIATEQEGFAHSYVGEEAIAAGVCAALRKDDYITSTHRGHGHMIAKDGDMGKMMAELYGRVDGYCKGKSGSLHIADFELGAHRIRFPIDADCRNIFSEIAVTDVQSVFSGRFDTLR